MRAEAAVEGQRFEEALEALEGVTHSPEARELEFRALLAESWARTSHGELRPALDLLTRARDLSEQDGFSDVERSDVLYLMGVCRYKLTSINTSHTLLSEALELADRSELPCDRLRSHILEWRSRCSRRQRDFEAAREDIERALELAERLDDTLTVAHITFQASIVAERDGHWLRARTLAERAKELYEEHGDRQNLGRMLNNLGGLNYLLGKSDDAISYLRRATPSSCSAGARTSWTRSATLRSSLVAHCSSRSDSTKPSRPSQRASSAFHSFPPLAIARLPGLPRAIWRQGAATTVPRRRSTGVRQRLCRTCGSNATRGGDQDAAEDVLTGSSRRGRRDLRRRQRVGKAQGSKLSGCD